MKLRSHPTVDQLSFDTFKSPASAKSPSGKEELKSARTAQQSPEEELLSLAERLQSPETPPLERAEGYGRMTQAPYLLSPIQIAKALGQDPQEVEEIIALLALPKEVQVWLAKDDLSLPHVRILTRLRRTDDLLEMARLAVSKSWTCDETEFEVQKFLGEIERTEEEKLRTRFSVRLEGGAEAKAAHHSVDPLSPVWARLLNQSALRSAGQWKVQYRGQLNWSFDVKPSTSDASASRIRLAEWFRKMADALEG